MGSGINWASEASKPQEHSGIDWTSEVTKPKTFEEANAARGNVVQTDRLQKAQGNRDLGLVDPREAGNPDVPIEGFMRRGPLEDAKNVNMGASLKAGLVEDPDTKRKLIAKSLFPDDPNGHNRVGVIDDIPVYVDDDGKLRKVSPGWARKGAGIIDNAPEFVMGAVGSVSASPVMGGTLGAMGARGLKRAAAGLFLDEPQTVAGNMQEVNAEAATALGAGVVGKVGAAIVGRGKIVDFTPADVRTAEQARLAIKNSTGIDVDLAQASGNRKLIGLRAYAARFPGKSAELVQAAEDSQNGQLDTAVRSVMDKIAKGSPSEVAGAQGVNAAGMVIELAKGARNKTVAPYYDAARKVVLSGDVADTLNADPVLKAAAARVKADPIYQRDLAGLSENAVGFWHQVKRNLDDQISAAQGPNGEPNRVRILIDVKNDLNKKLEVASPEYKEANAFYAKTTREQIEPLEASAIGVLSRIKSPKAATAAAKIFGDPNVSASEIRATRASIEQQDPEAWNGLVRQWMASKWNTALKETQTGAEVNTAGKLRQALMGTPEDRAKAAAMLPSGAGQAFQDLMTAAQSLARTPSAGSNTMRDTEIRDQLRGQGAVLFKWITSARASIRDAAEQRALESNTLALTEAILDPAKQKQLRQVVKMSDGAKKAAVLSAILAGQVTNRIAVTDDDRMPSAPRRPAQQ